MSKAKKKEYDRVGFKQSQMAGCCGAKLLHHFDDDRALNYYSYVNDKEVPFVKEKKISFVERVQNAAANEDGYKSFFLTAITNPDDQSIAESGLKAAGFRVMRHVENPSSGNQLTIWIRE